MLESNLESNFWIRPDFSNPGFGFDSTPRGQTTGVELKTMLYFPFHPVMFLIIGIFKTSD